MDNQRITMIQKIVVTKYLLRYQDNISMNAFGSESMNLYYIQPRFDIYPFLWDLLENDYTYNILGSHYTFIVLSLVLMMPLVHLVPLIHPSLFHLLFLFPMIPLMDRIFQTHTIQIQIQIQIMCGINILEEDKKIL